jgi:tRNA(fMet)-specific endonuclease VapC
VSFLVDTDTCSAYIKGNGRVLNRFAQYAGHLHLSTISAGELYVWALRRKASAKRFLDVQELLQDVVVLEISLAVARKYGEIQATLLDAGIPGPQKDVLIAATALEHGLILVTHNTSDYANVPGLTVDDWLVP